MLEQLRLVFTAGRWEGLHRAEEWKQRKNGEADWEPVGWELSLPEGMNLENDEPRPDWEPVEWQPSEDS